MFTNPVTGPGSTQQAPLRAASLPAVSSAQEEASETATTTRQEAARGDQVAIRKLAKMHQKELLLNPPLPAKEPGKGGFIDRSV